MVILLNGSYRGEESNSNYFLGLLETQITKPCKREHINKIKDFQIFAEELKNVDALVIGMPLYVDAIPAQVVELMEYLYDNYKNQLSDLKVYVVSNLGFYESHQIRILLDMVKTWCLKMGTTYGGGLAIGAGGMMGILRNVPYNQGPNKMMGNGLDRLAQTINTDNTIDDIYVQPTGFPRWLYFIAANRSWDPKGKKFGNSKRDMLKRR